MFQMQYDFALVGPYRISPLNRDMQEGAGEKTPSTEGRRGEGGGRDGWYQILCYEGGS